MFRMFALRIYTPHSVVPGRTSHLVPRPYARERNFTLGP